MDPTGGCWPDPTVWFKRANGESSKQQINDEICSSADKVCSNDDLLTEILLRLPVLSLVLFKSVSKHWLSLITDPNFTLLRSQNPKVDPPSGLFLKLKTDSSEFTFLSLDSRLPVKKITSSFSFDVNSGNVEVLQSCNGLVLCCIRPDKFYVFNPTLNIFKLLPLPYLYTSSFGYMAIAFDHAVSPHYKVVYPRYHYDYDNYDGTHVQIVIYSSQTGKWSVSAKTFSPELFFAFKNGNVIYWRGAIHWIDYLHEVYHFNLDDIDNPHFIQVDTPKTLYERPYCFDKLAVSFDSLLLLHRIEAISSLQIVVYEMKNECSGWSVKYHINLDHIITKYNINHAFLNQRFIVLSVVFGEREEDLFFVVEVPGKLIRYNIISKTFSKLCKLVPTKPRADQFCSFMFNPSLASV